MRLFSLLTLSACLFAQDPRDIIRRSVELDQNNLALTRNYTYIQRQDERRLDDAGRPKSSNSRTWDVTLLEGSPYRRLIAHDDKPLPVREQQKEQEKLQKSIEDRRHETPELRAARLADYDRRRAKQREPIREIPEAFDLKLVGSETRDGIDTWVIDATPKPGYKPKSQSTMYLPHMKGRFWIDKHDYQWVRMEAETLDAISFGGFLLRVAKGTHLVIEQAHVNNEVWLPKRVVLEGTARLLLVKAIREQIEFDFTNYKKFQVDSRVLDSAGH